MQILHRQETLRAGLLHLCALIQTDTTRYFQNSQKSQSTEIERNLQDMIRWVGVILVDNSTPITDKLLLICAS